MSKYTKRLFHVIETREIKGKEDTISLRVRAITDPEPYRLFKLNNKHTVKIEKRIKGNSYELIDSCDLISTAQTILEGWVDFFSKQMELEDDNITLLDI